MILTFYRVSAMQRYSESLAKSTAYAPDVNLAAADNTSSYYAFERKFLGVVMNLQPGMMYWNGGDGDDYRTNIKKSSNPIRDIFVSYKAAIDNNSFNTLFDIVHPIYKIDSRLYYKDDFKLGGYDYRIRVRKYSDYEKKSVYEIDKDGFGHLMRFSRYEQVDAYDGGYCVGFYITGPSSVLLSIGTKTVDGYNYLVNEYYEKYGK